MFKLLFNPKKAERRPIEMMFIGIFYSSLSILISSWIFPDYASLIMVFFTVISCLYVVQGAIRLEEDKEVNYKTERWLLKEHFRILGFLLFLFIGFVISFAFWTIVLPSDKVNLLFSLQASVVDGIRSMTVTGGLIGGNTFSLILLNNLKVLLISLILAFFYGAGSILVLVWNASVMGFVIGEFARETLGILSLPIAFTRYFLHGIPEMLAYLTIALAGGMLFVFISRRDFLKPGRIKRMIIDTLVLVGISIVLLIVAGLIEVFISPYV